MPARFVSGHFLRSDGTSQQQAGHAWAEAYVPDLGWVGFDAANGICTTDAHARVAIGLDYLGAAPVRGTRYGGGTETLTVAVKRRAGRTIPARGRAWSERRAALTRDECALAWPKTPRNRYIRDACAAGSRPAPRRSRG